MADYVVKVDNVVVGWGTADLGNFTGGVPAGLVWVDEPYSDPNTQPISRIIRDWEFRNRFTQTQLVGIMRAAMLGDDIAALVWLQLSTASDGVDLDDSGNVAGVQYVASLDPTINPQEILA
jgi:hypothetical protein